MGFKEATRQGLYLRCAIFGPSGSGKTMTALRMAQGIAGKAGGRFAVIDTEARSASKYADRISFDVDDMDDKTIESYLSAMDECVKAGYKVLVIDSLSHAWRELTEEVDRITQASPSKNSFSAWGKVSPKQKKLVEAILSFPGHIIATMRSKTEWVVSEGRNGRLAPEKMGLAPEQGKGIEYEFDLLIEMNQNHQATVTKDRTGRYQDSVIDKPDEKFGASLYEWLAGDGKTEAPTTERQKAAPSLKDEGNAIIRKIGEVLTAMDGNKPVFTTDEIDEVRSVVSKTRMDKAGIEDLSALLKAVEGQMSKRLKKPA